MSAVDSPRLRVLKASLAKKQASFAAALGDHFDSVKAANGQPLNDKRNGHKTMAQWERQNNRLRDIESGIKATQAAIEREESALHRVAEIADDLPEAITKRLANGTLTQWRKHPRTFFVVGVDKARIVLLPERVVGHRYASQVVDPEQRRLFAQAFNEISAECKASCGGDA